MKGFEASTFARGSRRLRRCGPGATHAGSGGLESQTSRSVDDQSTQRFWTIADNAHYVSLNERSAASLSGWPPPRVPLPQRPLVTLLRIALVVVFRKRLRISWSTVAMVIIGAVVLAGLLSFFTWVLAL